MEEIMIVMSWDQSTKISAHCVFIDGEYHSCGIVDFHKMKDVHERVQKMGLGICAEIEKAKPDTIIIEEVAQQSNPQTLKLLARIQGIIIGFAAAHQIPVHIIEPSRWRSTLHFKLGAKVKREELKAQAMEYVLNNYGLELTEDLCEAVCINEAAHIIYDFEDEI